MQQIRGITFNYKNKSLNKSFSTGKQKILATNFNFKPLTESLILINYVINFIITVNYKMNRFKKPKKTFLRPSTA